MSFSVDEVVPESPLVYVSHQNVHSSNPSVMVPESESDQKSLEYLEGKISALQHRIHCMQNYQNDIEEELSSCQEENKVLNTKLEEVLNGKSKEVKDRVEENNIIHVSVDSPIIQHEKVAGNMSDQLRKTKENLTVLEDKNYIITQKIDELTEQKQQLEETIKDLKGAIKLAQDENIKFERDKRNILATLTEKDDVIEALQQYIFQLKEILDLRKDERVGNGDSLGKYFCPNKSLNTSANYSFTEEHLNLGMEVIDVQLKESKLALEAAEEKLQAQSLEFKLVIEAHEKKFEAEFLELKKSFECEREKIKMTVKEETEIVCAQKFKLIENELLESHQLAATAAAEKYESEVLKFKKSFELERDEIKLSAVKETQIKYVEKFNSTKAEMCTLLQAEVDRCAKLKEMLQESSSKQSILVESLNLEVAKAQAFEEEVENHKRQRAQIRSENLELQTEVYALKKSLEKQQHRVEELEQENLRSERSKLSHQLSDTNLACTNKTALPSSRSLGNFNTTQEPNLKNEDRLSSASLASTSSNSSTSSGRLKVVPNGSGCLFKCEDEGDFQFQEKNIETLKLRRTNASSVLPDPTDPNGTERYSELYRRNTMQPPHMKSCYPSEHILFNDKEVDENELKQLPGHKMSKTKSGPTLNHQKDITSSSSTLSHALPSKSASSLPSPTSNHLRRRVGMKSPQRPLQYFKESTRLNGVTRL